MPDEPIGLAPHGLYVLGMLVQRDPDMVLREMGIDLGGAGIAVAQHAADQVETVP